VRFIDYLYAIRTRYEEQDGSGKKTTDHHSAHVPIVHGLGDEAEGVESA
jgi:hypothetical protein